MKANIASFAAAYGKRARIVVATLTALLGSSPRAETFGLESAKGDLALLRAELDLNEPMNLMERALRLRAAMHAARLDGKEVPEELIKLHTSIELSAKLFAETRTSPCQLMYTLAEVCIESNRLKFETVGVEFPKTRISRTTLLGLFLEALSSQTDAAYRAVNKATKSGQNSAQ